ncbi:cobalt ECF transporter T component CbiQ [Chlorobaculum sp. MV4-Y]|uniref:cobalt ECF transporter T component CbiQ n=1 Tax=Chlorobaculum sp. MV4-Y TaxID=2976335 RepID=UPI0021AFC1FA|nr:cobalt ECF transporter T component CbiQ [Chlorobaculum sp. MV4-Y]UWX57762.1 cobalt ECF transporter T component CbiQ [Chlorobaculum sp. MV4-Y]
MRTLDHYAASSRLRDVAPGYKLLYALPPIAMVLWVDSALFSLLVFGLMSASVIMKGGVQPGDYLRMLLLPAAFLMIGTVAVAFDISVNPEPFLFSIPVGSAFIGATSVGLAMAIHLALKALASVLCLYFIALTTPVADLGRSMASVGIPVLLIEMTLLVYRFVFLLFETASEMVTAQHSRLGYAGTAASFRSLASLVSNLFFFSARRAEEVYVAMECRGYDGSIRVLAPSPRAQRPSLAVIALVEGSLLCVAIATHFGRLF